MLLPAFLGGDIVSIADPPRRRLQPGRLDYQTSSPRAGDSSTPHSITVPMFSFDPMKVRWASEIGLVGVMRAVCKE